MTKKDMFARISRTLKDNDIRKKMPKLKTTIHISDDEGNTKNFDITKNSCGALYSLNDIEVITNALLDTICDALRNGENVVIHGFGTFEINTRARRELIHPITGERMVVKEHYVSKFVPGTNVKRALKLYNQDMEIKKKAEESIGDI